jgi:hypothetical protein
MPVDEEYDAPPEVEVHQDGPDSTYTVPVRVVDAPVVRTDEMPTKLGGCRNIILPAGSPAVKVLNSDPHRKNAIMWALALAGGSEGVCIAGTPGDADAFAGAILHPGTGLLRYEWTFENELWARPLVITDAAGIWTGYGPSTADTVLSVVVEQWAR